MKSTAWILGVSLMLGSPSSAHSQLQVDSLLPGTGVPVGHPSNFAYTDDGYVVAGTFRGTFDVDLGPGESLLTSRGLDDVYVARFLDDGTLLWAQQIGGTSSDFSYHDTANVSQGTLLIDADGSIVVTGSFQGTVSAGAGAGLLSTTSAGGDDLFVARLSPSGTPVALFSLGNSSSCEQMKDAIFTEDGSLMLLMNLCLTVDLDPGPANVPFSGGGANNIRRTVVVRYGGANLLYASHFGLADANQISQTGLASAPENDVFIGGRCLNGPIDFDPGAGVATRACDGGVFVARFGAGGQLRWVAQTEQDPLVPSIGGSFFEIAASENRVGLVGALSGRVDVDPSSGQTFLQSSAITSGAGIVSYPEDPFVWILDHTGALQFANLFGRPTPTALNGGGDVANGIHLTDQLAYVLLNTGYPVDVDPSSGVVASTPAGRNGYLVALGASSGRLSSWTRFDCTPTSSNSTLSKVVAGSRNRLGGIVVSNSGPDQCRFEPNGGNGQAIFGPGIVYGVYLGSGEDRILADGFE